MGPLESFLRSIDCYVDREREERRKDKKESSKHAPRGHQTFETFDTPTRHLQRPPTAPPMSEASSSGELLASLIGIKHVFINYYLGLFQKMRSLRHPHSVGRHLSYLREKETIRSIPVNHHLLVTSTLLKKNAKMISTNIKFCIFEYITVIIYFFFVNSIYVTSCDNTCRNELHI